MMAMIFNLVIMHLLAPTFATVSVHSSKLNSKLFYRDQFDSGLCLQEASCIPLHNASCFGTLLPYVSTSIALAEDSISQFEVQVFFLGEIFFLAFCFQLNISFFIYLAIAFK